MIITTRFSYEKAFASDEGMPQLNPEFWISQIFWLTLVFGSLYILLAKFVLPKISSNLEARKSQIAENIEEAEKKRKESDKNPKFDNKKPIYLFNLNNKYDLDGDVSWNTARLINHSCSNNCDYEGKGLKVWVIAIRDIKKGEELTCDYGFSFDKDFKQFPCKCGSKKCCGYIVREGSRWRIKKKRKLVNNFLQI